MSDHEALKNSFTEVTGALEGEADYYLSRNGWALQAALSEYYEHGPEDHRSVEGPIPGLVRDHGRVNLLEEVVTINDDDDEDDAEDSTMAVSRNRTTPQRRPGVPGHISTLASLQRNQSSDEEEGQAFYAGGSMHSGQQVLGPPRVRNDDLVAEMFRSVRERGGTEVPCTDRQGTGRELFTGVGYRLGQSSRDSEAIGGNTNSTSAEKSREISLKLWKTGYTVDDGPMQSYTDPANMDFLNAIRQGQVPPELVADSADVGPVHLNMEDRRSEDYNAYVAKPKIKAFTGKGHLLGSPVPQLLSSTAELLKAAAKEAGCTETSSVSKESTGKTGESVKVDPSLPMANLRVRLFDGSLVNVILNASHTVGDLRRNIMRQRPEYERQPFLITTAYPNSTLDNDSLTLQEVGIENSCLILRVPK